MKKFTLSRSYQRDGMVVHLNDLLPGEEKTTAWVIESLICRKEIVSGTASGVDPKGFPFE